MKRLLGTQKFRNDTFFFALVFFKLEKYFDCLISEKTFVYLGTPKPKVTKQEGDTEARLNVDVNAYPKPNMTWYKDGALITDENVNMEQFFL